MNTEFFITHKTFLNADTFQSFISLYGGCPIS